MEKIREKLSGIPDKVKLNRVSTENKQSKLLKDREGSQDRM